MKLNRKPDQIHTHEGAVAKHISPYLQLRRSVMSCMLWEGEFYEDGQTISDRIRSLVSQVTPEEAKLVAMEARDNMKLRHVPLLIVREMARIATHKKYVAETLQQIIQRPDELCELLAIYWKEKRQPLSAQVKKGLARAFTKFNEYSLAKYNRDSAIKLKDVLFLCHAKPKDADQDALWKRLIAGELKTPDTWEVGISATKNAEEKTAEWTRLLAEKKLGGLALLRNLRNMTESKVPKDMVRVALKDMKTEKVLPFRFIAAAKHAMHFEPELEQAMFRCLSEIPKLPGKTLLLIDVSGSMDTAISEKSDLTRLDAACALAMLLREICDSVGVATFSDRLQPVPPRRGFALRDAVRTSQPHSGTNLGHALNTIPKDPDRLIVFTDEQSHDKVPDPVWGKAYMINVASNKNGVGYGKWRHIDGFSEAIVSYIQELERAQIWEPSTIST